ncbi:MAG: TAXI family TRAP transporter solute-binding subunit [Magnetovibrionaceae bacterium]
MTFYRSLKAKGAALAVAGLMAATSAQAENQSYILATATTGGTYYPVGVALATLTKVKLEPKQKISMSAITSAGSGENVKLLRENQAQFAIMQGLYGGWAWSGTGKVKNDGPQKNLRTVSMLWQNVEHFGIRSEHAKTGTVSDLAMLKGKGFSIGKKNSGTEGSGRTILGNLGIDVDGTFDVAYMGYGPSGQGFQNGNIDGFNIPAGPPVSAITATAAAVGSDLTILDFTDEQMAQANGDLKLWTRYVIPADTYPGQSKPINTIAQPNFLAVNEDVPEETVYLITKTIYENLPFLNAIHKATKAMDISKAIAGLPAPLHPGAARYYTEQGIEIPPHLIATN